MLVYGAGAALFTGAGADPICLEPESAPGPRTSGAGDAKKSGGSATLSTSAIIQKYVQYTMKDERL